MDRFSEHLSERDRQAKPYASTRIWNPDHDKLGMVGEKILCAHYGAPQDLRNKLGGDGGVDLEIFVGTQRADGWIKLNARATEVWPARVIVNCDKTRPDVAYVLVRVKNLKQQEGFCAGWLGGQSLMEAKKEFVRGEWAYAAREYRPMEELDQCFVTWRHSEERSRR